MNEKEKNTSAARAQKCLNANYKKLGVNVKIEKLEQWKKYAESKDISLYAMVHKLFEDAMVRDGFIVPESSENEQKK